MDEIEQFRQIAHYRVARDDNICCGMCSYCHTELDDTITVCDFSQELVDEYYVCDCFIGIYNPILTGDTYE